MSFLKALKSFADNQKEVSSKKILEWQKAKIEEYGSQPLKHQPIFIIGAPRTGSTILYQTITNLFDVLYVDNLVCKFHQNFFFGLWLSDKIYGNKPHNNYKADHGDTKKYGYHAPSECGQFWYRWLPKDHHYIEADEIPEEKLEEIRREVTAVVNYFDKPLVFKNLNAGQRIKILAKIFPKAYFINIKRDPLFNAQSILLAKRKLGIPDAKYWSIMPKNIRELEVINDPYEQIIKQIYFLRKCIDNDKNLVKKDRFFELNFENINMDNINDLCKTIGIKNKYNFVSPTFNTKETYKLLENEIFKIKKVIRELEW